MAFSSFFSNRLNLFYVLAFLPLLLVAYSYIGWPFSLVIPVYGFILLLIKKDALSLRRGGGGFQRFLGLLVVVGSFFVYYALAFFFESPAFYGGVNYAVYIFGLFLIFFEFSAVREAFAPTFLIVAASWTDPVSSWLEQHFSWVTSHFTSLIVAILNVLGIGATVYPPDYPHWSIHLHTAKGLLSVGVDWGCIGISSMQVFLVILVVTLFDEPASLRTKLSWAVVGVFGTLAVNVIRVVTIVLVDYFLGFEVGGRVHYFIGYVLFILWLVIFFYAFSKRRVLSEKILSIWQKLR
jgi:exosortase/archaeosortase family protein